jgi:L-serine dehydratase
MDATDLAVMLGLSPRPGYIPVENIDGIIKSIEKKSNQFRR